MTKKERTVSYTDEQIKEIRRRGEDRTDWQRVDTLTESELAAAIASDPDAADESNEPWISGLPPLPPANNTSTSGSTKMCSAGLSPSAAATKPGSTPS